MMLRAGARLVAASMVAAVMATAAAGSAQAAPTLSPAGPYTAPVSVTVSGTVPSAYSTATHYAIAECNVSGSPATWGQRCDGTPGSFTSGLLPLSSGTYSSSITLEDTFADVDFSGATSPTTTTTCKTLGTDQCAVLVSFYRVAGPPQFLGADFVNVTF